MVYNGRMNETTKWSLVIGAVALTVVGLFVLISKNGAGPVAGALTAAVIESDHIKGGAGATATLVEYSDFQCPACAAWEPVLQQVLSEYGDRVRFVYRHFPLPQHQNAGPAAYASEAAALQGKFWEMHDAIFDRQRDWAENTEARAMFSDMARSLGLDMGKFESDVDSDAVKERVSNDASTGRVASVNATPTFFVNGNKVQPRNPDELRALLDAALKL